MFFSKGGEKEEKLFSCIQGFLSSYQTFNVLFFAAELSPSVQANRLKKTVF